MAVISHSLEIEYVSASYQRIGDNPRAFIFAATTVGFIARLGSFEFRSEILKKLSCARAALAASMPSLDSHARFAY